MENQVVGQFEQTDPLPDVTVLGRLASGKYDFMDYFLLKPRHIRGLTQLTLHPEQESIFEKYRYGDLSFLKNVIRWSKAKRRA